MKSMKYRKLVSLVALGALAVPLWGCGSVSEAPASEEPQTEINTALEALAKDFAKAVADEAVRVQIKTAVEARSTGDTEVLYKDLVTAVVDGVSFDQKLAQASGSLQTQGMGSVNALAASVPNLHVAVPAGLEAWDARNEMPLVTYVPEGVDDTTLAEVRAFDAQGVLHLLDAQVAPDQPVVVLGVNERVDAQGELMPFYTVDEEGKLAPLAVPNGPRYSGSLEKVEKLYIYDDKEPWVKGDPEIWLQVKGATSPQGAPLYQGQFHNVSEKRWAYPNRNLYNWYSSYGDTVVDFWYESDGGATYTFKVKVPVTILGAKVDTEFGFSIKDDDDILGYAAVNFQDPYREYHIGNAKWYQTWQ